MWDLVGLPVKTESGMLLLQEARNKLQSSVFASGSVFSMASIGFTKIWDSGGHGEMILTHNREPSHSFFGLCRS